MKVYCSAIALAVATIAAIVCLFLYGVPVGVPDSNQFLDDFVGSNWILLLLLLNLWKAAFPNSKFLASLGATLAETFPAFKKPLMTRGQISDATDKAEVAEQEAHTVQEASAEGVFTTKDPKQS